MTTGRINQVAILSKPQTHTLHNKHARPQPRITSRTTGQRRLTATPDPQLHNVLQGVVRNRHLTPAGLSTIATFAQLNATPQPSRTTPSPFIASL